MKLLSHFFVLFLYVNTYGQWTEIGLEGTEIQMIANNIGYNVTHTSGPTPATGVTYQIRFTETDWDSEFVTSSGGGSDYGCCSVPNLDFINVSDGLRCRGDQGFYGFQTTNNNGYDWLPFASSIFFRPKEMVYVTDSIGYITGNSYSAHGSIYKLTPTESIQLMDNDSLFFDGGNIEFLNSELGFVIMSDSNQYSYLFKTINSGENWNHLYSDTNNVITSISFPDNQIGYMSSTNGKIHKTINAGNEWLELASPTSNTINSLEFINDSVGYLACNEGEIYRTNNGGESWINEASGTVSNLIDIQFVDINTAYCIDETGVLLKNNNVLSIESITEDYSSQVIIYPNPSTDIISISLQNNQEIQSARIFDSSGKHIFTCSSKDLDVSSLSSGLYVIEVVLSDISFHSTFIKK